MVKNILVIGERFLDVFTYCEAKRFDPAGPWPVLNPLKTVSNPGGAANVVENLQSLKGDYTLNVYFLTQKKNIVKTRYVCEKTNHTFCRIDENDISDETLLSSEQFFNYCNEKNLDWKKLDAICFSEYGKNFLTKNFISELAGLADLHNIPIFLDTKFDLGEWSKNIFCVKINEREYKESHKKTYNPEKYCKHLIVTLGENGARHYPNTISFFSYALDKKVETMERSGLGDVFFASLIIKYLEDKNLAEAIKFANTTSAFKASKKGIFPVNRKDIIIK